MPPYIGMSSGDTHTPVALTWWPRRGPPEFIV